MEIAQSLQQIQSSYIREILAAASGQTQAADRDRGQGEVDGRTERVAHGGPVAGGGEAQSVYRK